ncbi:MAG: methyltransferase, TrmH family [Chloroflexota bacterium]|jgi:TrmH family RNA methyltransferase|nr:methyltransferase, TrmH family [Chloroflexota bacterium]
MMAAMPSPAPPTITSVANPRLKAAMALRDRGERDRTGLTLVDGARELRRALDAGVTVVEAFVCESLLAGADARATLDRLQAGGPAIQPVSESAFARLAFGERAEGLVAVVRIPNLRLEGLRLPADPLIVVVESVEKPGNLGAILRSADGAGADAVIAASPRTDLFNPNAIRASAGTIFTVALAAATTAETIEWLRARQVRIIAARVEAAGDYVAAELTGPLALVVGAEAEGLSDAWSAEGIDAVRIPMLGIGDSLNVSVSAAILLYEARRQRTAMRS